MFCITAPNQGHHPADLHFADELRAAEHDVVQHAAPSVKVTPIAHASIGPISLLA
ncbi:MAG: hypothetical protein U1E47_05145 [Rivihabitans pingtungensis]